MRRVSKSLAVAVALAVLVNATGVQSAYAVFGVADTGDALLAQIVANGTQQLGQHKIENESLQSVVDFGKRSFKVGQDAYNLAKHTSQLAEAGATVAASMRAFSADRFGTSFREDMLAAFPELQWVQRAAADPLGKKESNPYEYEIRNAMKYCLSDYVSSDYKDACTRLKGKQEREQIDAMMAVTFGVLPTSKRATPKTTLEALEQTCEDRFVDAWKAAEAKRKMNLATAAKMADLQQRCLATTQATASAERVRRTYGVAQGIVNDARALDKDAGLGLFGPEATVQGQAAAAAKRDEAACAELERQQTMAANAMRPLDEAADASIKSYELCTSRLAEARLKAGKQYRVEQDVALAAAPAAAAAKFKAAKVRLLAPDGYNILEDPHHQTPHYMPEANQ